MDVKKEIQEKSKNTEAEGLINHEKMQKVMPIEDLGFESDKS